MDSRLEQVADGDPGLAPLLDVHEMTIAALAAGENTALSRSLRRVLDSLDDPNGVLSAFSSFASS